MKTDKSSMRNKYERQHMTQYWPDSYSSQSSRQVVITVSRHDLEDHKNKNGVATDLFCKGVIGHPGCVFLN